jgi:glyoxylase-like metal-dependent hydrolase (beta-lactamase superfamily II)
MAALYDLTSDIRIIKLGTSTVDPGNLVSLPGIRLQRSLGIGGGSTVTLVRDEDALLLVDTGYDNEDDRSPANIAANWRVLQTHLALAGIDPQQITHVFVTHWHTDHFGNLTHFPQAHWYVPALVLEDLGDLLSERLLPLHEGEQLTAHTVLLPTPGHTRSHGSLLWHKRHAPRIAISGDAILSLAWLQADQIWQFNADFFDRQVARASIAQLLHMADMLIPGHGQPFFSTPALRAAFPKS